MNRISLKPNDKVSKYVIDSVTGYGASCIVYKAWYKEDNNSEPHWVQLKELYPYDIGLFRDASNNLICKTEEDKKKFDEHKKNFEASNNMLVKLNSLTDSTSREIQSFPYNGTKYSIVAYSNGKQYSEKELQKIELNKLLGIIESLAISVNRLHEEGYLHLDIKPDNFLINDIGSAILFDVDSVVPINEIKYRNGISYSKKWAAPEVKYAAEKGKNINISYTADIYSIGLILFEAIMCRDFLPMETVSYNRNWDIENSIKNREEKQNRKVNINPKFYHKIKEIFEKTLDRNPGKRYNSAQELYDNLDKARDLLKENPWIIPSFRTVTPQFTGRKNELAKMNSILQKENTVFLHGFGGIGKSELALKYAEVYKDNFDTIVFCKYENSIKEALLNIQIANYENDSSTMTLRKIAELCDERTLIILDNFDVETDEDDYLDDFINNYHCKKIIATRTDFSKLYTQLEVEALGQDDTILLFEKESKCVPKTEDEEKTLNEILKLIGYHTYFTVILAKKKEMFSLSVDELKKQTEEMLFKNSGKVTVAKDGKLTTDTVDAMSAKLFDFNTITESQKQTLRNLYVLRWITLSRSVYAEIASFDIGDEEKLELMDSLNDLTRLGWILYNPQTDDFFLHPIMQKLVKEKLIPTSENCPEVFGYMTKFIKEVRRDSFRGGVPRRLDFYWDKYFTAFADSLDLTVEKNYQYLSMHLSERRIIDNNNLLLKLKNVLLKKSIYDNTDIPVINCLMFSSWRQRQYRGRNSEIKYVVNENEAKNILNICFKSYKAGKIDAEIFDRDIFSKMNRHVDYVNYKKNGESIDGDIWDIVLVQYLDVHYGRYISATLRKRSDKTITEDEFSNALLSINISSNEALDEHALDVLIDYIKNIESEKTIEKIAKIVTNEEKLKEKAYYYSRRFLENFRLRSLKGISFDLCCKLIRFSLYTEHRIFGPLKITEVGEIIIRANAYLLLRDQTNCLKCYNNAIKQLKSANENRWEDLNKEVLEILTVRKMCILPSIEFREITEAYVAYIEAYLKNFPSYLNICEEWYCLLLECWKYSTNTEKQKFYDMKLNKVRGELYGLEMKMQK